MGESSLKKWIYVAACFVVPIVWGVVSAWLFSKWDEKRAKAQLSDPSDPSSNPSVDYTS